MDGWKTDQKSDERLGGKNPHCRQVKSSFITVLEAMFVFLFIELLLKYQNRHGLPSLHLGGQRSLPLYLPQERRGCRWTRSAANFVWKKIEWTWRSTRLSFMRWSSHGEVILGGVSIHTSASRSAFPGLSLHVWDLMGRTQPGLRWDTVVRQTYSTTQIKINKQSEVFNPKHCSPPRALPFFFFVFFPSSVFSMNIQGVQDLATADSSCPWERLDRVAKTKGGKIEGERGSERSGGERRPSGDTRGPRWNEYGLGWRGKFERREREKERESF